MEMITWYHFSSKSGPKKHSAKTQNSETLNQLETLHQHENTSIQQGMILRTLLMNQDKQEQECHYFHFLALVILTTDEKLASNHQHANFLNHFSLKPHFTCLTISAEQ